MTTATEQVRAEGERQSRLELARRQFRFLVPFVKVSEPGVGMVPMQRWPHIVELNDALESERLIALAKCRQIGITTDLSSYALWHGMYVPNALAVIFSKGERDAWEFLDKSRAIYDALPPELQVPLGTPDNRENMTFQRGGRIITMPSTKDAGRGLNPTLVIMDEADYHEYLEECYNSVKPGLDDNQGQLILASTVNPYKFETLFQKTYMLSSGNGFKKLFFGWKVRPGRDQAWYEARREEYLDPALFEKEFPETEEQAFAPANAISAFDQSVLREMRERTKPPLETITVGNGFRANVWRRLQPGRRYAAGTDPSGGTRHDNAVTVIWDTQDQFVVADIMSNTLDATEITAASVELLAHYDSPIWAIEDNGLGIEVIHRAQELKYRHLYHRDNGNPGWHTFDTATNTGSRTEMWGDLIRLINSGAATIPNAEGLSQLVTVIRNWEKRNRAEAQQGARDDYPTALAIAWQMKVKGKTRVAKGDQSRADREQLNGRRRPMRRWVSW